MKLSIIVPMYRVEQYIERCLNSIGSQAVEGGIECLIIDDCSPDNSRTVAERFISNYSGNVKFRIFHQEVNKGQSCARNLGISMAQGEYMMFVDSDDYIATNSLAPLIQRMDTEKLDLLCYGLKDIRNGIVIKQTNLKLRPEQNMTVSNVSYLDKYFPIFSPCAHIARREKVNDILFSPFTIHEDYAYMLKVFAQVDNITFDNTDVYFYDVKDSSTTTTTASIASNKKYVADWVSELNMLHKYLESKHFSPKLNRVIKKCLTDFHYSALTCLLTKDIPHDERLNFYRQFRAIPEMFKYGSNHLDFKRKLRLMAYCMPGGFRLLLALRRN